MKYSNEIIKFWLTIQKLFKGRTRGLNFFQGHKLQGATHHTDDQWKPEASRINFAVPSRPILSKAASEYTIDAESPGLLRISLQMFADHHNGSEIKLCMDGKRLATGFGKLDEEDLGGF